MFDRLFDFIAAVWDSIIPFVVVDCYERGVVLRFGKFAREIGPGLRWVWPLIEKAETVTVVRQTSYLDVQSLVSKDGKPVTINGILIFEIIDVAQFLLDIDDGESDMQNLCYGIIAAQVEATTWQNIIGEDFKESVTTECRWACRPCGVAILSVEWSDKAPARNFRLWNE